MDNEEYDILDELYFVISYTELEDNLDMTEESIMKTLIKLASKGWIRIYENSDKELDDFDLISNFKSYYYLASKKGLLAHNRQ